MQFQHLLLFHNGRWWGSSAEFKFRATKPTPLPGWWAAIFKARNTLKLFISSTFYHVIIKISLITFHYNIDFIKLTLWLLSKADWKRIRSACCNETLDLLFGSRSFCTAIRSIFAFVNKWQESSEIINNLWKQFISIPRQEKKLLKMASKVELINLEGEQLNKDFQQQQENIVQIKVEPTTKKVLVQFLK